MKKLIMVSILVPDLFVDQNVLKKGQKRCLQIHPIMIFKMECYVQFVYLRTVSLYQQQKDLTPIKTPTSETVSSVEKEFLDNIALFTDDTTSDYMCWLSVAIKMKHSGFNLSTFIAWS